MLQAHQGHQRHVERERFRRYIAKAWFFDLWGRITGEATDLVRFETVAQRLQIRQQTARGVHSVPMAQIVGSVGRSHDFTRSFLPRSGIDGERWVEIALAFATLESLPAVELFQIGSVYFVRDGHHRISVASVNGLQEIDANVIELKSPVKLNLEDFQHKHWWTGIEKIIEENDMFSIDADMAKHAFEERLRQAEHERLVQQMLANRPKPSARLRQWLGDFLIAFGTRLKVPVQQKFA